MQFTPENDPFGRSGEIVDRPTGFAIDLPLGPQAGPMYWEEHPAEYARLVALRRKYGITVADDMLIDTTAESSDESDEPARVTPRKRAARPVRRRQASRQAPPRNSR